MLGRTHLVMGLYLFLLFDRLTTVNKLILFLIMIFASLLPDIDSARAWLGNKLVAFTFGHRGFFHSVFPVIMFAIIMQFIFNNFIYTIAFSTAYLFHLLLDSFTFQGIKPFVFGPALKGFTKTGSVVDLFLFVFLICVSLLMAFKVI
ncbi:metal-dependent hydrolase [Candidatus Woesearchaeota archaeon]|nr:MAG: metal-dependent hydrolase [Candidatus Woesearchaeota archaeon]